MSPVLFWMPKVAWNSAVSTAIVSHT